MHLPDDVDALATAALTSRETVYSEDLPHNQVFEDPFTA